MNSHVNQILYCCAVVPTALCLNFTCSAIKTCFGRYLGHHFAGHQMFVSRLSIWICLKYLQHPSISLKNARWWQTIKFGASFPNISWYPSHLWYRSYQHAIILVVIPLSHEFPHYLPMISKQPEVLWPPKGQKSRRPSTAENRPLRRKAPPSVAFSCENIVTPKKVASNSSLL